VAYRQRRDPGEFRLSFLNWWQRIQSMPEEATKETQNWSLTRQWTCDANHFRTVIAMGSPRGQDER